MSKLFARFGIFALLLVLAACGAKDERKPQAKPKPAPAIEATGPALTILATSDLRDISEIAQKIKADTGVAVTFVFGRTVDNTDAVLAGTHKADAAWFASAKYVMGDPAVGKIVKEQERIMVSPVVIGVNAALAKKFGWAQTPPTWKAVLAKVKSGELKYTMSNPATSNQGFVTLMAVAASVANSADTLQTKDVNTPEIKAFLRGYALVGDSSDYLEKQFVERQGPELNAFINYESRLMNLNASGKLREPLTLIYPADGAPTADYPLLLLNEEKRAAYKTVTAYLRSEPVQKWITAQTNRRPVVAVGSAFPSYLDLAFSNDRGLADALLDGYLNGGRRPSLSRWVIDTSGSMKGQRETEMKTAIRTLTAGGASRTLGERTSGFGPGDVVEVVSFASTTSPAQVFAISRGRGSAERTAEAAEIAAFVDRLTMTGGTAVYSALVDAVNNVQGQSAACTKDCPQYSIVLFTDGERTEGISFDQCMQALGALKAQGANLPRVFAVVYGEGNSTQLEKIAQLTGGKTFDARNTPLTNVFREIRAYQ
jgi:Ca-activated chloride channel homolog